MEPITEPVIMPNFDTSSNKSLQVFVSSFSVNSFSKQVLKAGLLQMFIPSTLVPESSPIKLDLGVLGTFVPQAMDVFKDSKLPIDLYCYSTHQPTIVFNSTTGVEGTIKGECEIYVHTDSTKNASRETDTYAITLGAEEITFVASATMNKSAVVLDVESIHFGNITVKNNTLGGDVDTESIQ